jgi:hypothetical protein
MVVKNFALTEALKNMILKYSGSFFLVEFDIIFMHPYFIMGTINQQIWGPGACYFSIQPFKSTSKPQTIRRTSMALNIMSCESKWNVIYLNGFPLINLIYIYIYI